MTTITIPISESTLSRLQTLAKSSGLTFEDFVQARLEADVDQSREEFLRAKERVLTKNAELYRRLAQ